MKNLYLISILLFLFILSACSSGSEDDNMNPPPPNNNNVTYNGTVKNIIDANCISCHSDPPVQNAPMSLVTYTDVRNAVSNRGLINRVESGSMPPTGNNLTASQVQAIKDWQAGGFKEN